MYLINICYDIVFVIEMNNFVFIVFGEEIFLSCVNKKN